MFFGWLDLSSFLGGYSKHNLKISGSTAYPGCKLHKHSVSKILFFMLYHLILSGKF